MRYYLVVFTFFVFRCQALGQTKIQIVLKNGGLHNIDKIDAFDLSQKEIYDYDYRDTLVLNFKKTNIDCYNIRYHENGKMFRQQIWLDEGDVKIEAHIDLGNLVIDTVYNSPFYYKRKAFYSAYSNLVKSRDTTKVNGFLLDAFTDNFKNPFSLEIAQIFVTRNQNSKAHLVKLKSLLNSQGDKFKWFLMYPSVVEERVDKILTTDQVKISEFDFIDNKAKNFKLDLKGAEYYVLDFWFLACAPCLQDHQIIKTKIKELKEKNIELISISTDEENKFEAWKTYLAKNKYTWQNYMEDDDNSLTASLSINVYPTYVVINKTGEVVGSYNSFSTIAQKYGIDK